MFCRTLIAALILLLGVPIAAQAPAGWRVRVDHSQSAQDPDNAPNLKVTTMEKGFHVIGGPAGTFWNPAHTATGNYTARATFTLMEPSNHTNYYGLVFGGGELQGTGQNYIYFLVAQNGTFLVKRRIGEETHDVKPSTPHAAIKRPDGKGQSTNALEVRVSGNAISYGVNGTVVHATPKTGMTSKTDGIVGVRVNHLLNVHVEGFEVQKQ